MVCMHVCNGPDFAGWLGQLPAKAGTDLPKILRATVRSLRHSGSSIRIDGNPSLIMHFWRVALSNEL
jgi:hypothetical protein